MSALEDIDKDLDYCRRRLEELAPDDSGRPIFEKAIATFRHERDLVSFAGRWGQARARAAIARAVKVVNAYAVRDWQIFNSGNCGDE